MPRPSKEEEEPTQPSSAPTLFGAGELSFEGLSFTQKETQALWIVLLELKERYTRIAERLEAPYQEKTQTKADLVRNELREIQQHNKHPAEAAKTLLQNKAFTQRVKRPGFDYSGMIQGTFFRPSTGKAALEAALKAYEKASKKAEKASKKAAKASLKAEKAHRKERETRRRRLD